MGDRKPFDSYVIGQEEPNTLLSSKVMPIYSEVNNLCVSFA